MNSVLLIAAALAMFSNTILVIKSLIGEEMTKIDKVLAVVNAVVLMGSSLVNAAIEAASIYDKFKGQSKGAEVKGTGTAKYGNEMGKMGKYTEKPDLEVDWDQYSDHGVNESMVDRGITKEMVDSYVKNGKALDQGNGKFAFVSKEGVAIVTSSGKLVTTWSSSNFDANMLEIIKKLFGE